MKDEEVKYDVLEEEFLEEVLGGGRGVIEERE